MSCCITIPISIVEWIINAIFDKRKKHLAFQDILSSDLVEIKLNRGLISNDTPVIYANLKRLLNKRDDIYESIVFIEMKLLHEDDANGRQIQSSSTRAGEKEFNWNPNEKFQFIVNKPSKENAQLLISAYEYVPKNSKPELLGEKILKLNAYEFNTQVEEIIKLKDPKFGKSNYELELVIEVVPASYGASHQIQKVYEFQRFRPATNAWEDPFLPTDPQKWFSTQRKKQIGSISLESCADSLREGWTVERDWYVKGHDKNPDGWEYASGFNTASWFSESQKFCVCRRRTWERQIINLPLIKSIKNNNTNININDSNIKSNRQNMNIVTNQNSRRPINNAKDSDILNPII